MKWYTIFVEGPIPGPKTITTTANSVGQQIALDEKARIQDAKAIAERCSREWEKVSLYSGKMLGTLVAQYEKGKLLWHT